MNKLQWWKENTKWILVGAFIAISFAAIAWVATAKTLNYIL